MATGEQEKKFLKYKIGLKEEWVNPGLLEAIGRINNVNSHSVERESVPEGTRWSLMDNEAPVAYCLIQLSSKRVDAGEGVKLHMELDGVLKSFQGGYAFISVSQLEAERKLVAGLN